MKRIFALFFSFILIFFCFSPNVFSKERISVSARAAFLYCPDNNETVFAKNADERLPVASTTKIMTSVLALEENTPDRVVTVSKKAVSVEGTSMGLKSGDKVSLYTLVCGMLLSSGNDAANAVAEAISGSTDGFALLMNKKAKQIGMNNTSFVTPSGLDSQNHLSTAHDMALLGAYAIKNDAFREICSSESKTVSFVEPEKKITLYNHNRLLRTVDGVFGIKTGFTKKSGRCLVSACERNGVTLVCVTLNDPDDWLDHKKLYDYGFGQCRNLDDDFTEVGVRVVGGDLRTVDVMCKNVPISFSVDENSVSRLVLVEPFVYAPVAQGQKVGTAYYYDKNGSILCSEELFSMQAVDRHIPVKQENKGIFDRIKDFFRGKYGS